MTDKDRPPKRTIDMFCQMFGLVNVGQLTFYYCQGQYSHAIQFYIGIKTFGKIYLV